MAGRPRDFTVYIEAALDGDIGASEYIADPTKPPINSSSLKGVTVSDAGTLRGPPDGEDESRRRSLEVLKTNRDALRKNERYAFAREVAGHLGRDVNALLERDHVVDASVSHRNNSAKLENLSYELWVPATYSRAAIVRTMDAVALAEYTNTDDKARKNELLANACYTFVAGEIQRRFGGQPTPESLRNYMESIQRSIDSILRHALPSNVTGANIKDLIMYLQYITMIQIGQNRVVPSNAYEDLTGSMDILEPIISDKVLTGNQVLEVLDAWDKKYNNGDIKKRRDRVERINFSRMDDGPRSKSEGPIGYPKDMAHLPEVTLQVMFSPTLSSAANAALDLVRRTLNVTQTGLGTNDPVEFVSLMCSEGMKVLFTQIVAVKIKLAEIVTPRRPEPVKEIIPILNAQYTEHTLRLSQYLVKLPRSPPRHPLPYYMLKGENSSDRPRMISEDDKDWVDEELLGVPMVGNKRQRPGGKKTGGQIAAEALNAHLIGRYV